MNVLINQQPAALPDGATVRDAVAAIGAQPPFAVAVNTVFIPKAQYASERLRDGDEVEVIAPVTGG